MSRKEVAARVVKHNGGMSLEIDGRIQPFTSYKITETPDTEAMLESARLEVPGLARQGVTLCWVPVFVGWTAPGQYDFSDMDVRIRTVLGLYDRHAVPGSEPARIVVRIQAVVFTPVWYVRQHADAGGRATNLVEFRNPWATVDACPVEKLEQARFGTAYGPGGSTLAISPGDAFWDTHAVDCLKAIIAHVRASDYAHRVFGWLPTAFNTNEWFLRTFAAEATCDFSAPTQRAFREHLRSRGIPCEDQPVPSPVACQSGPRREFLDPADPADRRVEEFSLWLNNRMADIILGFARVLRAATADRPKLIGFFYGYTLGLSRLQNLAQSGHLAINRLLDSPDVDFLCSPCEYFHRADEKPFTSSFVMGPLDPSAALRNKLVFLEEDHPPAWYKGAGAAFTTRDDWHDEMAFRRNFAQVLSHGQQLWWYSLGAQWLKDESRQAVVGRLHRIGVQALGKDRGSVAEVAVVIDERSISAMRFNPLFQQMLLTDSHAAFFQTGAPFDCFELRTFLVEADVSRYKVVAFLNLFRTDPQVRAAMARVKGGGRTLIFSYASGLLAEGPEGCVMSADAVGDLTGMRLAEEPSDLPLTVWVDPARSRLMPGGRDIRYGWTHIDTGVKPPVIGIADPDAEPLGYLRSGRVGLARKAHPSWTCVFSSAPAVPADVLRELFRAAGVHLYIENGDVVYVNRSMLALSAATAGRRTLSLPGPARLVDAIGGDAVKGDGSGRFALDMARNETRVFWVEKSI